ncbi:TlpA family protein disulfide reductase [Acutalibacter sp. 1XD8-33]|uniref:redoxin domain-containing protein n=1 Tax=Acutalibacter sp. 1XD8-33 TaxID=2320081 RepID=UPI000EA1132A|nr:redoxin domain-containing protein [Acutalibacter sp. 1XD8-33]RKJ40927.1 TlpA family protein disulfide reductase [Acutalibacter sp. 1XD8-33]
MRLKRIFSLGLAVILSLTLLAGCSEDSSLNSFSTNTLDGGTFTQEDIKAKDVTVINFWGTFCGPCRAEMPDLAAYAKALPENVQLVTVCVDSIGNTESAKEILQEAGFEGVTLLVEKTSSEDFLALCASVQAVPTTIFMDRKGNIMGDALIGRQKDLAESFTKGVNAVLKSSGKAEITVEVQ